MKRGWIIATLSFAIATISLGQTSDAPTSTTPNSRNPGTSADVFGGKRSSKKVSAHKYLKRSSEQLIKEYHIRVRKAAKKYKKEQKLLKKPEYTNIEYYGHKKKPKIRKLGKRKFCKECEIVH